MNEMILFGAVVVVVVAIFAVLCCVVRCYYDCRKWQEAVRCAFIMPQVFNLCDRMSNSITRAYIELYRAVVNFSMVLKTDDFCVYLLSLQGSELSSLWNTLLQEKESSHNLNAPI